VAKKRDPFFTSSDLELVQRAAAEPGAWDALYTKAILAGLDFFDDAAWQAASGGGLDALDHVAIVEKAFGHCVRRAQHVQIADFEAYLLKAVRNLAYARCDRDRRIAGRAAARFEDDRRRGVEEDAVDRAYLQMQFSSQVDPVRNLSPLRRQAFLLRTVDGLDPAEAAQRAGVPQRVMNERYFYARRQLRQQLGEGA